MIFRRVGASLDTPARRPRQPRPLPHGDVTAPGPGASIGAPVLAGVVPRRALIIVQCSASKTIGGISRSQEPVPWPDNLQQARARLRAAAGIDDERVMPAWRRYTGGFYTHAGHTLGQAVAAGAHIVILSGGYGLVRADEPIGVYNRVFDLADWPRGLLCDLLVDEATRVGARAVVAFTAASTHYARLVRRTPWRRAGITDALLVSITTHGGGAMVRVPRGLGQAFAAFWQQRPEAYPRQMRIERLS